MRNNKIISALQQFVKKYFALKVVLFVSCVTQLNISTLKASVPMILRLNVIGNSMQNETVVYFDSAGSFTYNYLTDAPSLGTSPGYLNIITRFDSIDYQIKCLPVLTQNMIIPIKVITGLSGSYQIYGSEIQNLPAGACITLHDNITNTDQDIRLGSYTCNISDTESVARFVLNISIAVLPVTGSFINPTCKLSANGFLIASPAPGAGSGPWSYYWKDSLNNIIKTSLLKNAPDTLSGINAGAYRVDITSNGICTCSGTCTCNNGACTNGTLIFYLHATQSPVALFTPSSDTSSLIESVVFTNNSINASSYWWDFGDGMGSADTNSSNNYASTGTFTVTLTAIGSLCPDTSVLSKQITIAEEQTTGIKNLETENKNMFISRDQNGYFVKFGYTTYVDASISVTDLFGQSIISPIEVKAVTNEKMYIPLSYPENKIFIISSVSATGEKTFKKFIN